MSSSRRIFESLLRPSICSNSAVNMGPEEGSYCFNSSNIKCPSSRPNNIFLFLGVRDHLFQVIEKQMKIEHLLN